MNITREEKKAEAVRRMKLWGIYGPTREQFRKSNLVSISEPPLGACYWVNDEEKADIEAFEKEYSCVSHPPPVSNESGNESGFEFKITKTKGVFKCHSPFWTAPAIN